MARRRLAACVLPIFAALVASAGCAPRSAVHLIPLGHRRLPPTGDLLRTVHPDRAWWWLDEQGRLCIAMHESKRSILGKPYGREFDASLLLEAMPAGSSRTYTVQRQTMRHRERMGYVQLRSASASGLVTVSREGEKRLRVRMRLEARQQSFWVFTGWGGDTAVLWVGEFTADLNQPAGESVWIRTEEGKLARTPAPGETAGTP
jgi:hypothetical protein